MALIKVGAATETEMKERKARVEDALHATRAAAEEGIVPGGGIALLRAIPSVKALKLDGDEAVGAEIVMKALQEPSRQIVQNAGFDGSVVVERLLTDSQGPNWGFNADKGEYDDLVKAGIIDPTKVVRMALQNASSIASLIVTTEVVLAEKPKEEEKDSKKTKKTKKK